MKKIIFGVTICFIFLINSISSSICPSGVYPCNNNVQFNNPTLKTTSSNVNYSQVNVNNSDYLDSKDSSYFYPASNPSGFISSYIDTDTDSWQGNYTNYYNKTQVDNNLSGVCKLNQPNDGYINISTVNKGIWLYSNHSLWGDTGTQESINLVNTIPEGKSYLAWYGYDRYLNDYDKEIGWFGCHYNSTSGNGVHSHCSLETLDNSTGTPSINSHFAVSYASNQTFADVTFPSAVVRDMRVDDIYSATADNIDLKSDNATRIYPSKQTTMGLSISNSSTTITLTGLGTNQIEFLDEIYLNGKNITGQNATFKEVNADIVRNVTIQGVVTTASATLGKTVTIPSYNLKQGDLLSIRFLLGNSASNPSLSVNGFGNIPIVYGGTTNASTTTFTLGANATVLLFYDGGKFHAMGSYRTSDTDTDTYDKMYWGTTITAGKPIYDYKLMMQGENGKFYPLTNEEGVMYVKNVSQVGFMVNSPILYYATTTNVAENGTLSNVYTEVNTNFLNYTSNVGTWTSQKPIYLKGSIDSNGLFRLYNLTYTGFMNQTLPTTEDGYVYILLGYMYGTFSFRLTQNHPIYEYSNGKVQLYTEMKSKINGNLNVTGNLNVNNNIFTKNIYGLNNLMIGVNSVNYLNLTTVGTAKFLSPTSDNDVNLGTTALSYNTGYFHQVYGSHYCEDGTAPLSDGTYTIFDGSFLGVTSGTITIKDGLITSYATGGLPPA